MQYMLLIYDNEKYQATRSKADTDADYMAYDAFSKEFASAIKGGDALHPSSEAKTVRVRDGKSLITDGPFAETKEQLGGFYAVEAPSIEAALAIAAKIPWATSGSIEVRPILKFS